MIGRFVVAMWGGSPAFVIVFGTAVRVLPVSVSLCLGLVANVAAAMALLVAMKE